MLRVAVAALLVGCAAPMAVGVAVTSGAAGALSAMQRQAGGCIATCTNGTACNPKTGLCERSACDALCGRDEHCEVTATQTLCVQGPPSDVVSSAPGSGRVVPALQPTPTPSGPPIIVPAAEQNPPSH